jgi:hypothetical protein
MQGVLVDSNGILDLFLNDPGWADWSEATLEELSAGNRLFINSMISSHDDMPIYATSSFAFLSSPA